VRRLELRQGASKSRPYLHFVLCVEFFFLPDFFEKFSNEGGCHRETDRTSLCIDDVVYRS